MGQLHTAVIGDVKGTAGPHQSWQYQTGQLSWMNITGHTIYIKRCWILMGVQGGIGAHDFSVNVWTDDPVWPGAATQIVNENVTIPDDCTIKWQSDSDYYQVPKGGSVYWSAAATLYDPVNTAPKLLECCVRIAFTLDSP